MKRRKFLTGAAAGGVAAATATVSAPAISQGVKHLKMVTTWPKNFPALGTGAERLAQRITTMSGGKLQVKVYAGGELVPPFQSFDAVSQGKAEMCHSASYYWQGKSPAFNFFAAVPYGFTADEHYGWMLWGDGLKLYTELCDQFGVVPFMRASTGVQMGGWYRKEMTSLEDFKGLKFRMPGLGGDVIAKLGASPVSLPGGQIYENLVSGAIDATEWVGPWNDSFLKFYEAAKYYYYPGMHEPGSMLSLGVNKKFWDGLSKTDQLLVTAAAEVENSVMMSEYNAKNGEALSKLISDQGVKLRSFSDDIYDSFGEAADEVFEEVKQHSPEARKIHESFLKSRTEVGSWAKISDQAYVAQRNRVLGL